MTAADMASPPQAESSQPRWQNWLFRPVDPASLAAFRIAFGVVFFLEQIGHRHLMKTMWVDPMVHFPYWGFGWAQALPLWAAWLHAIVIGLSAAMVAIGAFTRWSALVFALSYGYLFLIEQTYFNNHFYLALLIAVALTLTGSERAWSVDRWLGRTRESAIPFWHLLLFRGQLAVLYTFGAITKINGDWLRGEPMRGFLLDFAGRARLSDEITTLLTSPPVALGFAYSGLLLDLLIVPVILWRRTRWFGVAVITLFHLMNSQIFLIGIFPWLAISSTVLLLDPSWPRVAARRALGLMRSTWSAWPCWRRPRLDAHSLRTPDRAHWIAGLLAIYFLTQLLVPLRHHVYPGNWSWTEEGVMFAWNMKLNIKLTFVGIRMLDRNTGRVVEIDQSEHMHHFQYSRMWQKPRLIAAYVQWLDRKHRAAGADPVFDVRAIASLNGRPYQYLIDPDVDLTKVSTSPWYAADWIVPLKPNQPIGLYPRSHAEEEFRVMSVIRTGEDPIATMRDRVPW